MLHLEHDAARALADTVGGAADGRAVTWLAAAMTDVGDALPGGSAAAAARDVGHRLGTALDTLDDNLRDWATGVQVAGQVLVDTDRLLAARAGSTGQRAV